MATLLSGKEVAASLNETLIKQVDALRARGVAPTLAIVRVGERADDIAYETNVIKRSEKLGMVTRRFWLPETVSQKELLSVIALINGDRAMHGCLLFRPLPEQCNGAAVLNALAPEKDVDGITDVSLAGVFTGTHTGFPPCTAQACMEILDYYHIDTAGKRAVVIGRSLVVGRPAAMLLLERNATVTICHTKTVDMPAITRDADILVVAAGRPGVIGGEHVAAGQTVIDVGIHVDREGKLTGDVRFAEAEPVVGGITPVPGGVGTVTTSVLLKHVVLAAERASGLQA